MALTKEVTIGKVEVLENGSVQVRTDTVIKDDGVELSRSYHRHVYAPDCDHSGEDAKVAAICAAVHTPEVKAAYAAQMAEQEAEMAPQEAE